MAAEERGENCSIECICTADDEFLYCDNPEPHWCEKERYDDGFEKIEEIMLSTQLPDYHGPQIVRWKQFPA